MNESKPHPSLLMMKKFRKISVSIPLSGFASSGNSEKSFFTQQTGRSNRRYFEENGFIEVETPCLGKSTPEGARDYLVQAEFTKYVLRVATVPQIFKQLLMVSGFDRYYQIVKCFRDEDLRADRQPEFTQIDVEMSFITEEDIMNMMEGLMKAIFKTCLNRDITLPLPRLTYTDAVNRYGKDNPDVRFGMEIVDLSSIVRDSRFKVFAEVAASGGVIKAIKASRPLLYRAKILTA